MILSLSCYSQLDSQLFINILQLQFRKTEIIATQSIIRVSTKKGLKFSFFRFILGYRIFKDH